MGVKEDKAKVRAELGAFRIRPDERKEASILICNRISSLHEWISAKTVLFYAPRPDEPDILSLTGNSKTICFPRYTADRTYEAAAVNHLNELVPGKFDILEPSDKCNTVEPTEINLILVPGVAFDKDMNRLGRGRGFYDRWLKTLSGEKMGVGFDHQLINWVPKEPHDVCMGLVITPSRAMKNLD